MASHLPCIFPRRRWLHCGVLGLSMACKASTPEPSAETSGETNAGANDDTATTSGSTSASDLESASWETQDAQTPEDGAEASDEHDESIDPTDPPRFDLGQLPDAIDLPPTGCRKVDFLFVIDNSGSMADEQENLRNSFPGFIAAIEDTLELDDFHVMVVDTDTHSDSIVPCRSAGTCWDGICECTGADCCECMCGRRGTISCNGTLCDGAQAQHECDIQLGAGRDLDSTTHLGCDFPDERRYLAMGDEALDDKFACAATLGVFGDGLERPIEAMLAAAGPEQNADTGCNAGFLREDAILVVTVITDEEENGSWGEPADWATDLIALKSGESDAIVPLGLIGDRDLSDSICEEFDGASTGAQASPRLRSFFDRFGFGMTASVCEGDYSPFFAEAVAVIDRACDIFDPPG